MFDYIGKDMSYYYYIVTTSYLWDSLRPYSYLVATNFQHKSQQTKVHDLNEETSRIDASKRRVASPRVVVHGMHPTKAEMQEPKDASRRPVVSNPDVLKETFLQQLLQGVPLKRWRFQFIGACASLEETSQNIQNIHKSTHQGHRFLWVEVETMNLDDIPIEFQTKFYTCLHPRLQNIASKREDCQGELLFQAQLPFSMLFFLTSHFLDGYVYLA